MYIEMTKKRWMNEMAKVKINVCMCLCVCVCVCICFICFTVLWLLCANEYNADCWIWLEGGAKKCNNQKPGIKVNDLHRYVVVVVVGDYFDGWWWFFPRNSCLYIFQYVVCKCFSLFFVLDFQKNSAWHLQIKIWIIIKKKTQKWGQITQLNSKQWRCLKKFVWKKKFLKLLSGLLHFVKVFFFLFSLLNSI